MQGPEGAKLFFQEYFLWYALNVCMRCGHTSGVGTDVIIFWLGILLGILEIILQADSSKQIAGFLQISSNICQGPAAEK